MRLCVVGCGALGGLFAAQLGQLEDVETWVYDVDAELVAAISRDGLRVSGLASTETRVHASSDPAAIPSCRFGILATKAQHTGEAIAATAPALLDGAVCSIQNGVGSEEEIAARCPRVIVGSTLAGGHLAGPGEVVWDAAGDTTLGPYAAAPAPDADVAQLAALLSRAGLPTRAVADPRGAQWSKMIFNAAGNPVGALTGLPHGRVWEDPELRRLVLSLVAEGVEVATALGVELEDDPGRLLERAAETAYDHRPSMLQDVAARRPTEVGFLNEAIVRFGEGLGLATPFNAATAALIRGVEASWA